MNAEGTTVVQVGDHRIEISPEAAEPSDELARAFNHAYHHGRQDGAEEERQWWVERMSPAGHRVVVAQDSAGGWRWTRRAANGRPLSASTEGYHALTYATEQARDLNPGVEVEVQRVVDGERQDTVYPPGASLAAAEERGG